jgi:hypothetical protein
MGSGRYFSSISRIVDCLIEDKTTIGKAHGNSNSPLRDRLLSVFTFAGTIVMALYLAASNSTITKNDNISLAKNLILLKLRI